MVTKAIVTIASGAHLQLLELSRLRLDRFARRHGYQLIVKTDLADLTRPPSWAKIGAIREALMSHDVVLWLDSDTLILRDDEDIVDCLHEDTDFAWVDHGTELGPNCGVMVLRRRTAIFRFLDEVEAQSDLVHHPWWEQAAIMRVLGIQHPMIPSPSAEGPDDLQIQCLDMKWNFIRQVQCSNPIIRHYAGEDMTLRLIAMAECILSGSRPADDTPEERLVKRKASEIIEASNAHLVASRGRERSLESRVELLLLQHSNVMKSTSWKVTGPLRRIKRLAEGVSMTFLAGRY